MAGSNHKDLPVRGVYKYFKALEKAKTIKAFLEDCDTGEHTLGVSRGLFRLGHKHFAEVSRPKAAKRGAMVAAPKSVMRAVAVGTECPACPKPPKLG